MFSSFEFTISFRVKSEKDIPVFYVSFENPKKMENVQKLECKDKLQKYINVYQTYRDNLTFVYYVRVTFFMLHDRKYRFASSMH